jgi:hypothetical protein
MRHNRGHANGEEMLKLTRGPCPKLKEMQNKKIEVSSLRSGRGVKYPLVTFQPEHSHYSC